MGKALYEIDGRIGRITLNRPEVMNAIDDELPRALSAAVAEADADPGDRCHRPRSPLNADASGRR
jgi:enoyl-CoA hydratase